MGVPAIRSARRTATPGSRVDACSGRAQAEANPNASGCATDNLVQAACATGRHGDVAFDGGPAQAVRIALTPARPILSPLFDAIATRQTTRGPFDGKDLARSELAILEQAGAGPGVEVLLLTGPIAMETVLEFVVAANTSQMQDPAFAAALGLGSRRPDLVVRFGRGPAMPRSLRRPVEAVLA